MLINTEEGDQTINQTINQQILRPKKAYSFFVSFPFARPRHLYPPRPPRKRHAEFIDERRRRAERSSARLQPTTQALGCPPLSHQIW